MYPSIANVSSVAGGAESFYTGNAIAENYGRPHSTYYPTPQPQYSTYDKRASIASPGYQVLEQRIDYNQYPPQGQAPPQQSSWQPNEPSSTPTQANPAYPTPDLRNDSYAQYPPQSHAQNPQRTPSYQAANPAPTYAPEMPQQPPPPMNAPSQPVMSPPADPNAAFYFNNASQAPPQEQAQPQYPYNNPGQEPSNQPPEQSQPQYPPAQMPQQYHSIPTQQASPQQFSHQPVKQQAAPQHVPPPQQQQQTPYWENTATPQAWQTPNQAYGGYTQESFPSAPHHAPQQNVMEESLIDL